ncbi:MAG TPA: chromosomal replication initiator protein DnaA [Thermoanaerobaculaceae bacterium]|jgi:chromosomal replication initiator protein|nr:chromosomal replication initiator protein DnaA [Thermoanaerobaculaceae bacterium]
MPSSDLWSGVQSILRTRLSPDDFEVWFAPLGARFSADRLTLVAPSRVYADYIHDHFLSVLQECASQAAGHEVTVSLDIAGDSQTAVPAHRGAPLKPRYTFAAFVPGPSNQFARAAAQSVAENPGRAYNPLFLYGGSGLGKTHLLHAIGNEILARNPRSRVRYVPTENFVNELINSIRLQRMAAFREAYRSIHTLLLDDVHILAGKERTQEEFFHTFNALHEAGHQIVLTSDTSPATIQGLEERLRTRFVWGLVADIQPPDLETKCAIIREKAHTEGVDLPDDVVLYIARRVRENVRELEGYLNRVIVYCTLTGQPATLETVRNALTPLLPEERHATPSDIIRFVAHHYGVKVADLKGRDNRRSVAFPRQVAIYLVREILQLSYPEIGKLFAKHHSTVMYSVETITEERRSNPSLDATLTTFVEHFR